MNRTRDFLRRPAGGYNLIKDSRKNGSTSPHKSTRDTTNTTSNASGAQAAPRTAPTPTGGSDDKRWMQKITDNKLFKRLIHPQQQQQQQLPEENNSPSSGSPLHDQQQQQQHRNSGSNSGSPKRSDEPEVPRLGEIPVRSKYFRPNQSKSYVTSTSSYMPMEELCSAPLRESSTTAHSTGSPKTRDNSASVSPRTPRSGRDGTEDRHEGSRSEDRRTKRSRHRHHRRHRHRQRRHSRSRKGDDSINNNNDELSPSKLAEDDSAALYDGFDEFLAPLDDGESDDYTSSSTYENVSAHHGGGDSNNHYDQNTENSHAAVMNAQHSAAAGGAVAAAAYANTRSGYNPHNVRANGGLRENLVRALPGVVSRNKYGSTTGSASSAASSLGPTGLALSPQFRWVPQPGGGGHGFNPFMAFRRQQQQHMRGRPYSYTTADSQYVSPQPDSPTEQQQQQRSPQDSYGDSLTQPPLLHGGDGSLGNSFGLYPSSPSPGPYGSADSPQHLSFYGPIGTVGIEASRKRRALELESGVAGDAEKAYKARTSRIPSCLDAGSILMITKAWCDPEWLLGARTVDSPRLPPDNDEDDDSSSSASILDIIIDSDSDSDGGNGGGGGGGGRPPPVYDAATIAAREARVRKQRIREERRRSQAADSPSFYFAGDELAELRGAAGGDVTPSQPPTPQQQQQQQQRQQPPSPPTTRNRAPQARASSQNDEDDDADVPADPDAVTQRPSSGTRRVAAHARKGYDGDRGGPSGVGNRSPSSSTSSSSYSGSDDSSNSSSGGDDDDDDASSSTGSGTDSRSGDSSDSDNDAADDDEDDDDDDGEEEAYAPRADTRTREGGRRATGGAAPQPHRRQPRTSLLPDISVSGGMHNGMGRSYVTGGGGTYDFLESSMMNSQGGSLFFPPDAMDNRDEDEDAEEEEKNAMSVVADVLPSSPLRRTPGAVGVAAAAKTSSPVTRTAAATTRAGAVAAPLKPPSSSSPTTGGRLISPPAKANSAAQQRPVSGNGAAAATALRDSKKPTTALPSAPANDLSVYGSTFHLRDDRGLYSPAEVAGGGGHLGAHSALTFPATNISAGRAAAGAATPSTRQQNRSASPVDSGTFVRENLLNTPGQSTRERRAGDSPVGFSLMTRVPATTAAGQQRGSTVSPLTASNVSAPNNHQHSSTTAGSANSSTNGGAGGQPSNRSYSTESPAGMSMSLGAYMTRPTSVAPPAVASPAAVASSRSSVFAPQPPAEQRRPWQPSQTHARGSSAAAGGTTAATPAPGAAAASRTLKGGGGAHSAGAGYYVPATPPGTPGTTSTSSSRGRRVTDAAPPRVSGGVSTHSVPPRLGESMRFNGGYDMPDMPC